MSRRLFVFAAAWVAAAGARVPASSVHIAPTSVAIVHGETSASFTIDNPSAQPVTFTVTPFAWRNDAAGEMVLTATDDVIVFPVRLTIAPGETRRVRVGARVLADRRERAYRVILDELPAPAAAAGGVAMRMRFNLPVFVQPKERTATVDLGAPSIRDGRLRVTLANLSGLHVTPQKVEVAGRDANGAVIWRRAFNAWYLLAGESREYTAAVPAEDCRRTASLLAETEFLEGSALTLHKTEAVPAGACQQQ